MQYFPMFIICKIMKKWQIASAEDEVKPFKSCGSALGSFVTSALRNMPFSSNSALTKKLWQFTATPKFEIEKKIVCSSHKAKIFSTTTTTDSTTNAVTTSDTRVF